MKKRTSKLPESLPRCQLIDILASKANLRHDIDFNFIGQLDTFHQTIRSVVGQINLLFPKYTPHDDQYHLKNLFHIADTILGNQQLESMNSSELFILACSIYGHDWGMAVSDSEKHYIVTGRPPDGMTDEVARSLESDRNSFSTFASKHNLPLNTINNAQDIDFRVWQEYVRQTHAIRSSMRTKRYFENIDAGVAESVMRVTQSHSLDFEELRDPLYPTIFAVLREEVNLRALAVYLRLIDLFDFAHDRTPYVLWKYVAPRNLISSMEWAKHRSLQPITCPRYLDGRSIHVDGSTDDHEVFAALEDLHRYCDMQLKGSNDILSRMNDPRHNLGIYNLEWHVAPRGFSPVLIQFEFDRQNMFTILSDEVYEGDCYVFLRELLQNSIDAIRFRRAILQRRGFSSREIGVIEVTVEHQQNGYILVTFTDDGIGMDEYIVRNYLAVLGKSYYRSPDFEREGIDIDPISRFGIGILSCFMVADLVEINTYKDPYFSPISPPLRIKIPSLNRQFRTEILPSESAQPGTTVKVYVDPNKIAAKSKENSHAPFLVTPYLRSIAGFVEFPIIVREDNKKTIIISPYQHASEARHRFGEEYEIASISLSYPWNEAILPQDISAAQDTLREERYDLKTDLKLDDYEGVLIYLVPKDDSIDFSGEAPGDTIKILNCQNPEFVHSVIRWTKGYGHLIFAPHMKKDGDPRTEHPRLRMHRDGILVPRARFPEGYPSQVLGRYVWSLYTPGFSYLDYSYGYSSSAYMLLVNLTKSNLPKVDLTRTSLTDKKGDWAKPIFQSHLQRLFDMHSDELIHLEPAKRLLTLARMSVFYDISPHAIWQLLPKKYFPVPLLHNSGHISFTNSEDLLDKPISLPPDIIRLELGRIANNVFVNHEEYDGFLKKWVAEPCLALFATDLVDSISVRQIRTFFNVLIGNTHQFTSIHFLNPPWEGNPPLLQHVYEPITIPKYTSEQINSLLDKSGKALRLLDKAEKVLLIRHLTEFFGRRLSIASFPKPFDRFYAYENEALNTDHPAAELLLRILSKIVLSTTLNQFTPDILGQLRDAGVEAIASMPSMLRSSKQHYDRWVSHLRRLGETVTRFGICSEDVSTLVPDFNEFIPDSLSFRSSRLITTIQHIEEFGQIM